MGDARVCRRPADRVLRHVSLPDAMARPVDISRLTLGAPMLLQYLLLHRQWNPSLAVGQSGSGVGLDINNWLRCDLEFGPLNHTAISFGGRVRVDAPLTSTANFIASGIQLVRRSEIPHSMERGSTAARLPSRVAGFSNHLASTHAVSPSRKSDAVQQVRDQCRVSAPEYPGPDAASS